MDAVPPLQVSGSLIRAYLKTLASLGQLEAVRERVQSESAAYMEEPPMAWTWVDGVPFVQILGVLGELAGEALLRTSGALVAQESLAGVLSPVLRTALSLSGTSPGSVYKHLAMVAKPYVRGATFVVQSLSERASDVRILYPVPRSQPAFRLWEGLLSYPFELTKMPGVVRAIEPFGESEARYHISW